jgi:hypothetical protein
MKSIETNMLNITPLMRAAVHDDISILVSLLALHSNEINLFAVDKKGRTALGECRASLDDKQNTTV